MSSLQNSNINVITEYIAISIPNIVSLSKAGLLSQLNLKGTDELRFLLQLVRIRNSSPMPTLCNFESLSLVNCIPCKIVFMISEYNLAESWSKGLRPYYPWSFRGWL